MNADQISRLHAALPKMRLWVQDLLAAHEHEALTIQSFGFKRLEAQFPTQLLDQVRVIPAQPVPYPPVDEFGLSEFKSSDEDRQMGITFLQRFFFREGHASERLFFHELVHVVQWSRLGFDRFLLSYVYGLANYGYENSPLERMAYSRDERFSRGESFVDLVGDIDHESDAIWRQAASALGQTI